MNKKMIFILSVAVAVVSVTIFASNAMGKDKTYKYNYKNAIFEKNGDIYQYNEDNGSLRELGEPNNKKIMPFYSNNYKKVAFVYADQPHIGESIVIGIIDQKTGNTQNVIIATEYANSVTSIDWIDDGIIGVEGHINPSTSEYFVVNWRTGEVVNYYIGSLFTPLPNKSVIYRGYIPYGQEQSEKDTYFIDGKLVYTSQDSESTLTYPQFSKSMKKISFIEENNSGKSKILTGSIDLDNKEIWNISSIEIPDDVSGTLEFDNDEEFPSIVNSSEKVEVSETNKKLEKKNKKLDIDFESETNEKLGKLNEKLKEKFGETIDKEIANIQNLQWFE